LTGKDGGDDVCMFVGDDNDIVRWADAVTGAGVPQRDTPGYHTYYDFGSPHVGGFNAAFCDGSVHTISFGVSAAVHAELANRKDGAVIDPGSLSNN
jgi:prepilin-type processing-associated H-X9-DG protein